MFTQKETELLEKHCEIWKMMKDTHLADYIYDCANEYFTKHISDKNSLEAVKISSDLYFLARKVERHEHL